MVAKRAGVSKRQRAGWQREKACWSAGFSLCGMDEVGTGAWAGPVYAGAVVFPAYVRVPLLMDSKKLRFEERALVAEFLRGCALWGLGKATVGELAALGLRQATFLAMQRAYSDLFARFPAAGPVGLVVVDGVARPVLDVPVEAVVRADACVASVAAASVLAKFARDTEMASLDERFPGYGFALHKGYGTPAHQEALLRLGPCAEHRMHYAPLREKFGLRG